MLKKSLLLLTISLTGGCQSLNSLKSANQLAINLNPDRSKVDIHAYLPNGKPASAATIIIKDKFGREVINSTLNNKGHYQFRYPPVGSEFVLLVSSSEGKNAKLTFDKMEHYEGGKQEE